MLDYASEHNTFKDILKEYDRVLLTKANKTSIVEQEMITKQTYTKQAEFSVVTDTIKKRLNDVISDFEQVKKTQELIKYTIANEIRNAVKQAVKRMQDSSELYSPPTSSQVVSDEFTDGTMTGRSHSPNRNQSPRVEITSKV